MSERPPGNRRGGGADRSSWLKRSWVEVAICAMSSLVLHVVNMVMSAPGIKSEGLPEITTAALTSLSSFCAGGRGGMGARRPKQPAEKLHRNPHGPPARPSGIVPGP